MRGTYRKNFYYEELNKKIILVGILFMTFILLGTSLNKLFSLNEDIIISLVNSIENYYSTKDSISIWNIILSNLKLDFKFFSLIGILNLMVVTFPLAIIIFMLKGISIGYTINSCILLLKSKSLKLIFVALVKNFAIIPGTIILSLISFKYIKEMLKELKNNNTKNICFLIKRYILNLVIIMSVTLLVQVLLNFIFINILQFLVR